LVQYIDYILQSVELQHLKIIPSEGMANTAAELNMDMEAALFALEYVKDFENFLQHLEYYPLFEMLAINMLARLPIKEAVEIQQQTMLT